MKMVAHILIYDVITRPGLPPKTGLKCNSHSHKLTVRYASDALANTLPVMDSFSLTVVATLTIQ
jgi:hypothetical protein